MKIFRLCLLCKHLLLLLLALDTARAASANQDCEGLLHPTYRLDRLTFDRKAEAVHLSIDDFDFFAEPPGPVGSIAGRAFLLTPFHQDFTELLQMESFDQLRKKLIRKLLNLQKKPKFRNRSILHLYEEVLLEAGSANAALQALKNREEGVEIAAWVITFNDKKVVTAIHTSADGKKTQLKHLTRAYENILSKSGRRLSDVVAVEYFHVHPQFPLSPDDIEQMSTFGPYFRHFGNTIATFHMMAIIDYPGRPLIHHFSY